MKPANILLGFTLVDAVVLTFAHPGMERTVQDINRRIADRELERRNTIRLSVRAKDPNKVEETNAVVDPNEVPDQPEIVDPNDDGSAPPVLIGDIKNGGTTPIGKTVARILLRQESGESNFGGYKAPGSLTSKQCKADTCCVWFYISTELTKLFVGGDTRCNKNTRAAIRLGFHDAGTWSQVLADQGKDWGGADGSIALSSDEGLRLENNGLQDIITKMRKIQGNYGVGMGDMIQFAAIHAVVSCPLGPWIRFFAGRKDSKKPAIDGLLPGVDDSADKLIKLFQDKTISPHDLVALLGAHTTSQQFFVDTKRKGAPQDGTRGVWDTLFYNQTLKNNGKPLGPKPKEVSVFRVILCWRRIRGVRVSGRVLRGRMGRNIGVRTMRIVIFG